MSRFRINLILDLEDYPIPADGDIELSLSEDLTDAIKSVIDCNIVTLKIKEE